MSPTSAAAQVVPAPTLPDLSAVKTRQQGAWSSGDYAVVGTTLQIVGESCARRSTCVRDRRCSTSRPATATSRWRRRGAGAR